MADPNPNPHPRGPAILRLAILAAILTIGLTGVTFWLSYEALHVLAAGHGLQDQRAWAWPATIDTFIVIGEVLILRASLLGRVDWLAVTLTASGSVGSIVLNVASAGEVDRMTQVVHAVPPCGALLIFTALMRQIYRALTAPARPTDPARTVVERTAPVDVPLTAVTVPALPPRPATPPALPPVAYTDPRCTVIRRCYDTGTRPGTATMRAALAAAGYTVSDSLIRGTIRAEVEQHEPHLRTLPAEQQQIRPAA